MSNRHEVQLEVASILSTANDEVGAELSDVEFVDRLTTLVEALQGSGLDPVEQSIAAEALTEITVVRMRLDDDRRRYPEIEDETVTQPFIIAGFPRAGTTFLHALLGEDPANRAPLWWEVMHPSPPPGNASPDDHRRQLAQREVADFVRRCPGVRLAHPYFVEGADTLMECESILTFDLRNTYPFSLHRVPRFLSLDLRGTPIDTYAFHRRFLQNLQWGAQPRRWALKGTDHQFMLPALLDTYPDAIVLWPHRDPVAVVASLVELTSLLVEGLLGVEIDRSTIAPAVVEGIRAGLEAAMQSPTVDAPNVVHLQYASFTKDPIGQLRALYDRFDIPFTATYETRIRAWMADPRHRSDRYGKFTYSLERAGLERGELEATFAAYIERFDIPRDADR
jgi:hypothetical protein